MYGIIDFHLFTNFDINEKNHVNIPENNSIVNSL